MHTQAYSIQVFVAASQSGCLNPEKPMRIAALNPKLQQLCTAVGLLERNTYYSLRRSAVIEVRHEHGTELAQQIAHHKPSANSLFFYDNVGFGDMNMQNFRMGLDGDGGLSRADVRKFFSQAHLARWQADEASQGMTLEEVFNSRVKASLPDEPDYQDMELQLKEFYEKIGNQLADMQSSGAIPEEARISVGFTARHGAQYRALMTKYGLTAELTQMEELLKVRKRLYRAIRLRLRHKITESLREEHRALLNENIKGSSRVLASQNGFQPKVVRGTTVPKLGQTTQDLEFELDRTEEQYEQEEEEGGDEGVNEEILQAHDIGSREESECWIEWVQCSTRHVKSTFKTNC